MDERGLPVKDAAIFARDANGAVVDRMSGTASDESGNFRYAGLAPGRYTFAARSRTKASQTSAPV